MLQITGWKDLSGEVRVSGSKNATLPILGAALLLKSKVTLKGVPKIWDVLTFLDILGGIGVRHEFISLPNNSYNLAFDATQIKLWELNYEKVKKIRSSIFLLAPLLHFFGKISLPFPGGCSIGKRPIDAHINGLEAIGYESSIDDDIIFLQWELESWDKVLNAGFWVGSTENLLIANVLRSGKTTIQCAAIEPHVMNLISFLRKAWADIKIRYNHTIIVEWVDRLHGDFEFDIIGDYIESGTYIIIAALTAKDSITIHNACIEDLYVFLEKLKEAWVKFEDMWNDNLKVYRAKEIHSLSIQTNIFPWFPTDLQSPFSVLMTQADGINKIHEVLFEGRLNFLVELEKMKAKIAILNPHEALIFGKTKLKWGVTVTSWDLRAGAAMIIASLIAEGETRITNVEYIYRGYEDFVSKLRGLGALVEEIE